MKKILAAGALALAVAGAGTTAYADGGGHDAGARTIRLVEAHPDADPVFVDVGAKGPSIGDVAIAKDGLNREDGTHAGDFDQVCTLVALGDTPLTSTYECSGTITLPGGTVTMQGAFVPLAPAQFAAVSGGTGAYRAARGDIEIQAVADRFTVRLA